MKDQGYFMNTLGSLAKYDQELRSWKTYQGYLDGLMNHPQDRRKIIKILNGNQTNTRVLRDAEVIFPKSGMIRNGRLYPLPPLALPIKEKESGLLPTPLANDSKKLNFKKESLIKNYKKCVERGLMKTLLELFVTKTNKYPSSIFYERMMGYPENWTQLKEPVTPLSLNARN